MKAFSQFCSAPFAVLLREKGILNPSRRLIASRAFTLVEVVMAIGVVAFAFVAIFALLPAGLGVFRQAMDTSIGAQIAQRIVSEAEQTDFDALVPNTSGASQFYVLPLRYFDDQGTELIPSSGGTTLSTNDQRKVIYTARVRGSMPGESDPARHSNSYFTSLPSTSSRYNPRTVTFLTIQVIKNPGRLNLDSVIDSGTSLIDPVKSKPINLTPQTYTALVARNGYRVK